MRDQIFLPAGAGRLQQRFRHRSALVTAASPYLFTEKPLSLQQQPRSTRRLMCFPALPAWLAPDRDILRYARLQFGEFQTVLIARFPASLLLLLCNPYMPRRLANADRTWRTVRNASQRLVERPKQSLRAALTPASPARHAHHCGERITCAAFCCEDDSSASGAHRPAPVG